MRFSWPSRAPFGGLPAGSLGIATGAAVTLHAAGLAFIMASGVPSAQLTDAQPDRVVSVLEIDPPAPPPVPPEEAAPPAPEPDAAPAPLPQLEPSAPTKSDPRPVPALPPARPTPPPPSPAAQPRPPSVVTHARDESISFAGVKAKRARRIVYVVDASGPMVTYWRWVANQVTLSLARLGPGQQFQIIAVRTPPPPDDLPDAPRAPEVLCPAAGLLDAGPAATDDAKAWLGELRPRGASDFLPGLAAALRLQPDLVLLLAQGYQRAGSSTLARDSDELLAQLDRLNPRAASGRRRVIIKTVQFLEDDPTGLLRAIAESHGDGPGSYHIVTLREIRQSAEPQVSR